MKEYIITAFDFEERITLDPFRAEDVPELVRCRDCVRNGTSKCPCHHSGDPYIDWDPDDNWFCADGKHK